MTLILWHLLQPCLPIFQAKELPEQMKQSLTLCLYQYTGSHFHSFFMHGSDLTDLWLTLTCPAICLIRNCTTEKRDERIFSSWETDEELFTSTDLATDWPINWSKSVSYWPWAIFIVGEKKGVPCYVSCIIHKDRVDKKKKKKKEKGEQERAKGKKTERTWEQRERNKGNGDRKGETLRIWTKCKIKIWRATTEHGCSRQNSKFVESKWTSLPRPGFTLNYPFCLCTAAAQLWQPLSPETPPTPRSQAEH